MIVQAGFDAVAVTAAAVQDVWSLMNTSGRAIKLVGWEITSADIAAEVLAMRLRRITAVGSGGVVNATEQKIHEGDEATIVGTVRERDTIPGTAGTLLAGYQWEQLGPLREIYIPELRPVIGASDGIALVMVPATAFTMSGWVAWEE